MTVRSVIAAVALVIGVSLPVAVCVADALLGWVSGGFYLVFAPAPITFAIVGWLLTVRDRGGVIGPLCLMFAVLFAMYFPLDLLVRLEMTSSALALVATFSSASDAPGFIIVAMILILFPDGRLPGPRWRWTVPVAIVGGAASIVGFSLAPGQLAAFPSIVNPIGVPGFPGMVIGEIGYVALIILLIAAVVALVTRWRRGSVLERSQVKWVGASALALGVAEAANLATFDPSDPLGAPIPVVLASAGTALVPAAIGIAILRYRLYDIDRLISRTIGWALVTGFLVAVFAGGVLALQAVLAGFTQGETLAVAASTLLAFALFQPVRRRVQRAVDHRFDRARYDGERTAAAFAERLRDEIDLARLRESLALTARDAVRPTVASVWLRNTDS
jgi:hypothetical protein